MTSCRQRDAGFYRTAQSLLSTLLFPVLLRQQIALHACLKPVRLDEVAVMLGLLLVAQGSRRFVSLAPNSSTKSLGRYLILRDSLATLSIIRSIFLIRISKNEVLTS